MDKKSRFYVEKVILKYESSVGHLEFRFILLKDIEFYQELLKQNISDKDFSIKVLYNQLETHISFEEFKKLSDNELKNIISAFIKNEETLYNHYEKIESSDEFHKLKKSIQLYLEEWNKKILATAEAIRKRFEPIRIILQQSSTIPKLMSRIVIPNIKFPKIEIPKIFIPDFTKQYNTLLAVLKKQSEVWQNFNIQFKKISKKSLSNLKKYNWFINKSMPAPFIAETAKVRNAKELKDLFISYHIQNNCKVLDEYLLQWKNNFLFKKRMKILSDTTKLFKDNLNNTEININLVVIPVLINQIEGLRQDYLKTKDIEYLGKNSWKDPKTKKTPKWEVFYAHALEKEDEFTKLTFKIFSEVLFQKEDKPASIINFSRHKIAHGLNTRYGTLETTIRCFMILDWISDLK